MGVTGGMQGSGCGEAREKYNYIVPSQDTWIM